MLVVIISDSHGNIANLKQVMGFAKKVGAGAIVHCGDWNTLDSVNTVVSYNIPLYSVLGNADIKPEVGERCKEQSKDFNSIYLEIELGGRKIGVVHNINHLPSTINHLNVIFTGHYHSQKSWLKNSISIVRPGSLERDINFAIYDTDTGKLEFIHE